MRVLHISPIEREIAGVNTTTDVGIAHYFLIGWILKNIDFPIEFKLAFNNITETMYEFKPDIVSISAMSYNFYESSLVASKAKEIGANVIVGAHHISMLPNQLTKDMDIGVIGEGEETYLELINLYHQKKWAPNYWKDVKGIVFRIFDNEIHITQPRPLIKDLDSVGFPMREFPPSVLSTRKSIITARGCPYKCVFCSQTKFWQKKIRFHSPEYVIKEIENVYNFSKTDSIIINDGLFLVNKKRLLRIAELWEKHPLYKHIRFSCSAKANLIDDEMAQIAKRLGITSVFIGFESNNPDSLTYLKRGSATPDDNQRAYDIITKYDIFISGTFIIGIPEETKGQIMDTYKFIEKNPLLTADIYHLVPLPGTPVWDYALKRGLVSDDMDFRVLGGQEKGKDSIFLSEKITKKEIIELLEMFNKFNKKRYDSVILRRKLSYIYKDPLSIPIRILKKMFKKNC